LVKSSDEYVFTYKKGLISFLFLLAATLCYAQQKKPYNVLFIAVDDLNDWVGAYGKHAGVRTPNIDRLAKQGMLFTRAYCSAPSCNPSRASMLTGVRPSTSGVYFNNQPWRPAMPNAVTLPQYFTQNGYNVLGTGKIFHEVYNDKASWPEYYPVPPSLKPSNATNKPKGVAGTPLEWGPLNVSDSLMADFKIAERGIDYLKQDHNKPFFLAVGIIKPHLSWYVPQKYFDMYPLADVKRPMVIPNDLSDVPAAGVVMAKREGDHRYIIKNNLWEKAVQAYIASISFADAQIGRLLNALDNSKYKENTIVVLFGDHGWNLGEKEHWRKFALWEETTHVPFIISAPGIVKPNSVCDRTVNLMDIYPTLIDMCGFPVAKGIEAVSVFPLLQNPNLTWNHPSVTTWGQNNHSVRTERWRYTRYSDGGEELYDHNNDPHEWKNLASNPKLADIKKQLAQWLPKVNAANAASENRAGSNGE